jgi:hypothetical protein
MRTGRSAQWLGSVNSIFDRQQNLWLGTLYGLAIAATHTLFS